jgi:hypothetical protein
MVVFSHVKEFIAELFPVKLLELIRIALDQPQDSCGKQTRRA